MSTPLTAMTALEPLTSNIAAYTYTDMNDDGTYSFKVTAESESWETWIAQVADTDTYTVTATDTTRAEKFSSLFLSL